MIVSSMSEEELINEVTTDYVNVFRYSDHLDNKFRRIVVKSKIFPVTACKEYVSPRKNRWLIFLEARSKKETLDRSRITLVVTFEAPNGTHAVMGTFTNGRMHYIIYPPHFFARYRQRVIKEDITTTDLIKRFFKFNQGYVYTLKDTPKFGNLALREVYGTTRDGVAMGFMTTHQNVLFKTFITFDMLKGEQIETFTANEKLRQELNV